MAGIKTYVQSDLRVAPTQGTHLVRYQDMIDYINALTAESVKVVLTKPFIGTYSSIDLSLTQTTPEALEIDGVMVSINDRILVAGQLDKTQNGIYTLTVLGINGTTSAVLIRADDFNESAKVKNGLIIPITNGDNNATTRWKTTVGSVPFILDSASIEFNKEIVDLTDVVEMTFLIEGNDSEKIYSFTHGWNTLNITHELYDANGDTVIAEFRRVNPNEIAVAFGIPLGTGYDLTLVIRAEVESV